MVLSLFKEHNYWPFTGIVLGLESRLPQKGDKGACSTSPATFLLPNQFDHFSLQDHSSGSLSRHCQACVSGTPEENRTRAQERMTERVVISAPASRFCCCSNRQEAATSREVRAAVNPNRANKKSEVESSGLVESVAVEDRSERRQLGVGVNVRLRLVRMR